MNDEQDLFAASLRTLLQAHADPAVVRAVEAGGPAQALWQALHDSGFADALLPEAQGGAGLGLGEAFGLLALCGEFALPVPLGETLLARGLLAQAGLAWPEGPLMLAAQALDDGERLFCTGVPCARVASHVLLRHLDRCALLPVAEARVDATGLAQEATLSWPLATWQAAPAWPGALPPLRELQAVLYAAQMAGAMRAVFERSLQHANERQQFGRPIGKFQAIQHQLSVMAELVFASRMAARLGCQGPVQAPDPLRAALAKARCSEAAPEVAALAHSIHGAIGFTAEFDLQLYTRRLHAWRQAGGSESHWQGVLGEALVNGHEGLTLDLLRQLTDASPLTA